MLITSARAEWLPVNFTAELNPLAILSVVQAGNPSRPNPGRALDTRGSCADRCSGCAAETGYPRYCCVRVNHPASSVWFARLCAFSVCGLSIAICSRAALFSRDYRPTASAPKSYGLE